MNRCLVVIFLILIGCLTYVRSQELNTYRVINITLNTSAPSQLAIDRGRLIWRDTDIGSGKFLFKYYWGGNILQLDSNLAGLTFAISGDHIVWNTNAELVKAFDCRSWVTTSLGQSYNPDFAQPVTVSNDLAAYARRSAGTGTNIVVHRFSTGNDTLLSAGVWNTSPSLHHGEMAWVAADSEASGSASNIFLFDGKTSTNVSRTTGTGNRSPMLRDGQIAWLQTSGGIKRVKLFTGDSTVTLVEVAGGSVVIAGYDLSDGIAVAALEDTVTGGGSIKIYNSETGSTTAIGDSSGVASPHISSGFVAWQSGRGGNKRVKIFSLQGSLLTDVAAAENPVIDHDLIGWTLGDAVELGRPVTYRQLTTDGLNGWEQTKFKAIDSVRVIWGNFANSSPHARLFFWDGSTTKQLTDSTGVRDLIMANDGYIIWRSDFDSLYYYDGSHSPVKFVDTVQAENPYVAGGYISFSGLRLPENKNIKHAWLYDIAAGRLTQLTTDSSNCANVMCDGKTACWFNTDSGRLMFYDGATIFQLSDSVTDAKYSYRRGKLVWNERRNGVWQIMMYDVAAKVRTALTSGTPDKSAPVTDGRFVVWYENPVSAGVSVTADMRYYDIVRGVSVLVPQATYQITSWNWMANGKIAWPAKGNIYAFDGSVVSQFTDDDFSVNTDVCLDRGVLVWRRTPPPPQQANGQMFTGKLHAHAAFDAVGISGPLPLTVAFVNRSWEGNLSNRWDFGDGGTSNETDPTHTYSAPGAYTVTLTVTGPTGSVTERKYRLVRGVSTTSVSLKGANLPWSTELLQNFPNPFNPTTVIRFRVSAASPVTLRIFDLLGREVGTLVKEAKSAGEYSVLWDGSRYASGVYFYRLEAGSQVFTKSMMVLK